MNDPLETNIKLFRVVYKYQILGRLGGIIWERYVADGPLNKYVEHEWTFGWVERALPACNKDTTIPPDTISKRESLRRSPDKITLTE